MANKERGGEAAQRLLDTARARREDFEAASTEREAAIKRTREAIVEEIRKNSVYRRTMEVLDDPVLDRLLPLFWGVWHPIELVSMDVTDVTAKTTTEVVMEKFFNARVVKIVEEKRPAPYRNPRRVLPLDPVRFVNQYPADGTLLAGVGGIAPVTAYLRSIGLTTIEKDIECRFPPEICTVCYDYERSTSAIDLNQPRRQKFFNEIRAIRKYLPHYGGGSCGTIQLKTPAAPGRTGDQGRLRIEAGYDLQSEDFLIKLFVIGSPFDEVETFTSLTALQEKMAVLLVENGISAVE